MTFKGFPKETFAFLEGISANNKKEWFDANRDLYEAGYVEPGKAFVNEIGPRLKALAPQTKYEPRVNGSITRINRDIRFTKDKRPYKEHLALWFWQGETRSFSAPGFWFEVTPRRVYIGGGMYMFGKEQLDTFRNAVIHPRSGKALLKVIEAIRAKGDYQFGEKTRKLMPRGYEAPPDRAEYLLFEGLHAGTELPASAAKKPGFADLCYEHFATTWPLSRWILEEIG